LLERLTEAVAHGASLAIDIDPSPLVPNEAEVFSGLGIYGIFGSMVSVERNGFAGFEFLEFWRGGLQTTEDIGRSESDVW